MTAVYTILKVAALLAVIILPLFRPKKKKFKGAVGFSKLAVNKSGHLEQFDGFTKPEHQPAQ